MSLPKIIEFPKIQDPRGNLTFMQNNDQIPFEIKRVFWTYDVPGGETSRDFTFVENAVQANIKAMLNTTGLKQHEAVNIAVGDRTTLNELWQYITETAGMDLQPIYGPERAGDVRHSLADIRKAAEIIGYKPHFEVNKGLTILYNQLIHTS